MPLDWAIHAGEQLDDGRLASAVLADQSDRGPGRQLEVYVGQHRLISSGRGERPPVESDPLTKTIGRSEVARATGGGLIVLQPQHPAGGGGGIGERSSSVGGAGYLALRSAQQACRLDHFARRAVTMRSAQDQDD